MKSTLAFLIFFTFFNISFAQQINVTVSKELQAQVSGDGTVKAGNHFIKYRTIGSTNHLSYGFGWNKVRLGIEVVQYDSNMTELQKKSLSDGDRVYGPFFTDIQKINGKVYIIYHEVQEKNTVGNIMAVKIEPETMETEAPKIIGSITATEYKLKFSESLQNSLKYFFVSSPDTKRNVVMLTTGDSRCFISVLDENMNVLWSRLQDLAQFGDYEFKSVNIDNSGNVYVAYKLYGSKDDVSNSKNRIAIIREKGKPTDLILNLKTVTASDLQVLPSKDNSFVHVAGTYMDNSNFAFIKGVFYTRLNTANFKLDEIKTTAFPRELISRFEKDGWAESKGNSSGLRRQFTPRFFEKGDGVLDMIAEFRSVSTVTEIRSDNTRRIKGYYNFSGDILNVSFETNEPVFSRIPKYRRSAESMIGDSYTAIPFQNKVIIFYDDNDDNLKKVITESPSNSNVYKNLVLVAAIVEPDGTVTRKLVLDMKDENYLAVTESMIKDGSGKMLIPLQKIKALGGLANNMRWASIEINE